MVLLLFIGACGSGMHMLAQEGKPAIVPKADKAVLIIMRTMSFNAAPIDNYLDGTMIGQTQGKGYFVTEAAPGVHSLVAHADNTDRACLNMEPGRIYILQQELSPGWEVTTRYSPMTIEEFQRELPETAFTVYDPAHPGKGLPLTDANKAKADCAREIKEGVRKELTDYKGVRRMK
jgi:hypothetical protein